MKCCFDLLYRELIITVLRGVTYAYYLTQLCFCCVFRCDVSLNSEKIRIFKSDSFLFHNSCVTLRSTLCNFHKLNVRFTVLLMSLNHKYFKFLTATNYSSVDRFVQSNVDVLCPRITVAGFSAVYSKSRLSNYIKMPSHCRRTVDYGIYHERLFICSIRLRIYKYRYIGSAIYSIVYTQ